MNDAIGLRKTLQMLATIVGNIPDAEAKIRTILSVVPSSSLTQVRRPTIAMVSYLANDYRQ